MREAPHEGGYPHITPEEWAIMRRHPEIGKQLVERIPFLRGAVPIVYAHHEKWDGTGYPRGLQGEEIPLGARIFMVVDAFDAITFDRPYSKAQPFETAKAEIQRCSGKHFDPAVVTATDGFHDLQRLEFVNAQRLTEEELLGRARSTSTVPLTGSRAEEIVALFRGLHARYRDADGTVGMVYRTDVFMWTRRE